MPERRYRGESWSHALLRAELAASAERRAEQERAAREAEAKRARAARRRAAAPTPPPAPKRAETRPEAKAPRALGWQDLTPDELRRF